MGFFRWVDRQLWLLPVLVFLVAELAFGVWSAASSRPVLLAAAPQTTRLAVYSSLTGSSSALLGLAIAAVAIIAAFSPRPGRDGESNQRERRLARARTILAGSLLSASFFLLVLLVMATVALGIDAKSAGNSAIAMLIEGSGLASVVGLLVGGFGLALVIIERSAV